MLGQNKKNGRKYDLREISLTSKSQVTFHWICIDRRLYYLWSLVDTKHREKGIFSFFFWLYDPEINS